MNSQLTALDLCIRKVIVAHEEMALNEAARIMREQHVGSLVVVDEIQTGRVVRGMLTGRDIVAAVVAKGMDPRTLRVGDVMSRNIVTARESDSMLDVLDSMHHACVRRLPVTNARGELVGLIGTGDLLGLIAEDLRTLAQVVNALPTHADEALARDGRLPEDSA